MSIFTNTDRHTVLSYCWRQEQDRNFLERFEHKFECFADALEFVLSREFDAKIFNYIGELIHEHDHLHPHGHGDDGYCY